MFINKEVLNGKKLFSNKEVLNGKTISLIRRIRTDTSCQTDQVVMVMMIARGVAYGNRCVEAVAVGVVVVLLAVAVVVAELLRSW